jgi:phosphate starvation-inducible PhoH-like protein
VEGVAVAHFSDKDVVRHPLVSRVVRAYARNESAPRGRKTEA